MATPIEDKRRFLSRLMAEHAARAEETEALLRENRRELDRLEAELRRIDAERIDPLPEEKVYEPRKRHGRKK